MGGVVDRRRTSCEAALDHPERRQTRAARSAALLDRILAARPVGVVCHRGQLDRPSRLIDPVLFPTVLRPRSRRYDNPYGRVTDRRVVIVVAEAGENVDIAFDGLSIERGKAQTAGVGVLHFQSTSPSVAAVPSERTPPAARHT